jgi:hypothetical protein
MNEHAARAKIRALITPGVLPDGRPTIMSTAQGQIVTGRESLERSLICEEPGPGVSYTYPGGRVIRLHAACDALWQQERTR